MIVSARVPILAGVTIGVFDALGVAPAGSWTVRLLGNNPDVTLANDDVTTERGYPLNAQLTLSATDEEVYVRNNDGNDSFINVLLTQ